MAEEKVTVECPACKNLVRVPKSQARLRVKCPACQLPFVVNPHRAKPGEDTVAGWVNDAVEEADNARGTAGPPPTPAPSPPTKPKPSGQIGQRIMPTPERPPAPRPPAPPPPAPAAPAAPPSLDDTALIPMDGSPPPLARTPVPATPTLSAPAANAQAPALSADEAARKREDAKAKLRAMLERRKPEPEPPAPASAAAPHAPATSSHIHGATIDRTKWKADTYPQDINVAWAVPHLVVKECSPTGVRFRFDSVWLEHHGFRTSMPVRCFASGHHVEEELYARPMVFCDQSGGVVRSAQNATAGVGQRMGHGRTAKEVEALLSKVEHMAVPFDNPVPYYATMACGDLYMECTTIKRPDGGWTCEVLVPDLITALEWLINVNGITGPEYPLLENDVKIARVDSWINLPLNVRMRIASWVNFTPGEKFVRYFSDATAMAKESGLTGVIVTRKRLIHRLRTTIGEIDVQDESSTLIIRVEDNHPVLFLRKGTESSRIARLRIEEVNDFVDVLADVSKLPLELADL